MDIPPEKEALLKVHLMAIAKLFKVPNITLILRGDDKPGANRPDNLLLTNDNPSHAMAALRERMVSAAQRFAITGEQVMFEKRMPR